MPSLPASFSSTFQLLLLWSALLGCTAPDHRPALGRNVAAIISPSPDPDDDAVVAIEYSSGDLKCSGTLITPQVVLTAAHCGIRASNYYGYQVFVGTTVGDSGVTVPLVDALSHPGFDSGSFANDLTLLFLHDPATPTPKPLLTQPLDASALGATIRVAGYGITMAGANDEGTRHQGTATLGDLSSTELTLAPAPAQPCSYDSGGPAFITVAGTEYLAGVTSRGDGACASYSREVRVDAQLDFINGYLRATAPGQKRLGERCLYDGQCQSGSCLTAPDAPLVRYCSAACTSDSDCGALPCTRASDGARRCEYATPSPGAPGFACSSDSDCVAAACLMVTGEPQICAPSCSPTQPTCSTGFDCTAVDGVRYACLPRARSSGCTFTGDGAEAPGSCWLVLLALLTLARRRGFRSL